MTTVAVLGSGRMGSAMAGRLAERGFDVVVYNRTRQRARDLAARIGARVARSAADAASQADVLITMVADDEAVRALYVEAAGILDGLTARTVAVDMSTVLPETIRGIEPAIRRTGAGVLDAPVSGSTALAASGSLTIMVGGEAGDLERARPVLEALSSRLFHLGPLGSGTVMKLAVNAVVFGLNEALSEAIALAERAGVRRELAWDVLAVSAAGAPYVTYKRDGFLAPESTPTQFSIALAEKDLRLILTLAERAGVEMPQARTNLEMFQASEASVGSDRDLSMVAAHLRGEGVPMP